MNEALCRDISALSLKTNYVRRNRKITEGKANYVEQMHTYFLFIFFFSVDTNKHKILIVLHDLLIILFLVNTKYLYI